MSRDEVSPQSPTHVPPAEETTSGARGRFARFYGAKPWHLLSLLASFVVTGYAVTRLLDDTDALVKIVIWFVGAAVVWDFVLGPVLALLDRAARPLARKDRSGGVSPLNHLRFPALLSLLLLLVFAPLIFQRSEQVYQAKAGLRQDPYLERWASVTAVLFLASAALYAVRVLRARRRGAATVTTTDGPSDGAAA